MDGETEKRFEVCFTVIISDSDCWWSMRDRVAAKVMRLSKQLGRVDGAIKLTNPDRP